MKVNGITITWMVLVVISGAMDVDMKVNIKMIKNMVLEFIIGLMVEFIWVIGYLESSMA